MTSRLFLLIILFLWSCNEQPNTQATLSGLDYLALSQNILSAAKEGINTQTFEDSLKSADLQDLKSFLSTDDKRLAFWLNIYNSYIQIILKKNPDLFQDRDAFFSAAQIQIGEERLSLDRIEHELLRRSKVKYSKGYLNKPFASSFEEDFRVDTLDYRIHFALNCGAKSCPPIKFYDPRNIDQQLDLATKSYLKSEAEYQALDNSVSVPALMNWFKNDFGGEKGTISILKELNIIPALSSPKLKYKEYDWTLQLDNYITSGNE